MTIRKPLVGVSIAAAIAALSACSPIADRNYHGTVGGTEAPTVSTPSVPAYPVTITGSGEQVKTAELVAHGYTVSYQASSSCLIASPVQASGEDGPSFINQCGDSPLSGTTTFRARGRTTVHVENTTGPWSLTFTPLS
jgi:hypothetical protein